MPLRVLRSGAVVVPVGLAINFIVGGGRRGVGGGERDLARTAVFAGEGEVDVFRFEKILMAPEVVR